MTESTNDQISRWENVKVISYKNWYDENWGYCFRWVIEL